MTLIVDEGQSTSIQRTYRYLRLGIGGCVLIIAVAVTIASFQIGGLLPSISSYYYSPARAPFVGALATVGVGILALAGRGPDRTLLVIAALFAPLIGLIPTPIPVETVSGLKLTCADQESTGCVPEELTATVLNGVWTYSGVVFIAAVAAFFLARHHGILGASARPLIAAGVLVVAIPVLSVKAPGVFFGWGHLASAGTFFALIALVAWRNRKPINDEKQRGPGVATAFAIIGWSMSITVAVLILVGLFGIAWGPLVFVLEFIALGLFVVFWLIQSGRKWNETNPASPQ